MVKRKQLAEASSVEAVPVPPLTQPSKIPNALRFPILVFASMALSSLTYSLTSQFGTGDLATVMKRRDEWWEIGGLLAWKSTELAIGWWGEFDGDSFLPTPWRRYTMLTWSQLGISWALLPSLICHIFTF